MANAKRMLMKNMAWIFILLAHSSVASVEKLCPEVVSKGEGHWPISESKFNIENAIKAKKNLNKTLNKMETHSTPLTLKNSIGLYSEVKNDLIMIEGYILRAQALDSMANGDNSASVKNWCKFFETQAVVWH
jgi:hypothetical protein